ncbi:MAG: hypothetical protein KKB13_09445 [Chloroflexi bacterium]|nr:hypothetical protein [Chloroflexota bacterium]
MLRFGGAFAKDYVRSCLISLLAIVIVVPLFLVCICAPLGLTNQPGVDSNIGLLVLAVSAILFFLILVGGGWGFFIWTIWRRARQLDAVFGPLGLRGSMYMLTGRRYHGTVAGREVNVRLYRGPTVELRISTPLQTRLNVVEKAAVIRPLAGAFGYEPLALTDPGLQALSITALDEDWARRLLTDPMVPALLQRLAIGEGKALVQQVVLQPGTLSLHRYRSRGLFGYGITPDLARQWLDDLLTLLRIAEGLPAPQKTAELSSLEQFAQTSRSTGFLVAMVVIIVLLIVVLPICVVVPFVALLFMTDTQ